MSENESTQREKELTQREKEIELFGIALEDLEAMIKQKSRHRETPMTDVMIDWLEFAQSQLDEKYVNVNHIINRIIYLMHKGFVVDNPDVKD